MSMKKFRIAVGADHAGFVYKAKVAERLRELGHEVVDFGTYSTDPVDYPLIAFKVGEAVGTGEFDRGVLVCGSSIGIAIAANKVKGVRAAPVAEPYSARLSRQHNHSNIICFAERLVGWEMVQECLDVWLTTEGEPGRHERRVKEIDDYPAVGAVSASGTGK
jgi:ribose 5-phosphate isomerase B